MIAPMTFPIEIMLRGDERIHTGTFSQDGDPAAWSDSDVQQVLEKMLVEVGRAISPQTADTTIALRGLSWIVSPVEDGVVIAFEIHSASAVAGPFPVVAQVLDASIARVMRGMAPSTTTIH